MIISYILMDNAGSVIFTRELIPLMSEDNKALFSSALSAISGLLDQVFNTKVKHLETHRFHMYFGFGEGLNIVLISDIEDERLERLADKIIKSLEEMDLNPALLQIDEEKLDYVKRKIDSIIFSTPPSMRTIIKLIDYLQGFLDVEKGIKLDVSKMSVESKRLKGLSRLRRFSSQKLNVRHLLDMFYKGELVEVVKKASAILGMKNVMSALGVETDMGDLARILFAKAALTLNSFDPRVPAPSLEEIERAIEGIQDELAKKYLLAEFESFIRKGSHTKRLEVLIGEQKSIQDKLSKEDSEIGEIYKILLTPTLYRPILEELERYFSEKSVFLYSLVLETKYLTDFLVRRPSSIDEVFGTIGKLRHEFLKAYKEGSITSPVLFHIYQFALIWGILCKDLDIDDAHNLLKTAWDMFKNYGKELVDDALYIPNRHKGVNIYFIYQVVYRLLLEKGDPEAVKELRETLEALLDRLIYWINLGKTKRILVDMYYLTLSGLLSISSRLAVELDTFIRDIPDLIRDFVTEEFEDLWIHSKYHYAHLYIDLLEAIANVALFVDIESVRRVILAQVSYELERIIRQFEDTPMIFDIELLKVIRINLLIGTEEGREKALQLFEELRQKSSKFVVSIAEKMLEEYKRVEM